MDRCEKYRSVDHMTLVLDDPNCHETCIADRMSVHDSVAEVFDPKIYLIRGEKVMLDEDLARLYQIPTKHLNEQVSRNLDRFPVDFMFSLTNQEFENLKPAYALDSSLTLGQIYGVWNTRRITKSSFPSFHRRRPA